MLDTIKFNGVDLRTESEAKVAHINTAGSHIQIPMSEFTLLTNEIRNVDPSVSWEETKNNEGPELISYARCDTLYTKYGNLEFNFNDSTAFIIKPRGYLTSPYYNKSICQIGIQGISDSLKEYRLGTNFVRNFFVGLDYKDEIVSIGLKSDDESFQ